MFFHYRGGKGAPFVCTLQRLSTPKRAEAEGFELSSDLDEAYLLHQEDTASDEMKALKREVEEKQAVLQKRWDLLPKPQSQGKSTS